MKVIKATQQMLETRTLVLGFQGENLRTQLRIDCAATFAEYPNATPALAIKPPSGATYPVFVERDGNEVVWDIVANNLALKGDGELQLTFYKDSVIAKTVIGHITVNRSLQIDGEMPDVVATWIENANRKLAEVDAQIVELEGMVDTATDAAERAAESAEIATEEAVNAEGSAETATAKANEATQAAGTATAKAAEAALSATQASNSAVSAADSESGATAKAAEAAQSAQTATAKATQATEAAQTATEKAADASASATAAQASATNAASSATAAQSSQTAAKASETAAGASATQAAQSVLDAGANAQTAMQKAAEATQSATNAAASATNAATSAETASTKAGEAAQSAQAVEQTAEQLADSLEQIAQNTQDIAELDERKANIDGYYPDMTVGNAEQLNSSKYVENSEPYTLRTSGGTSDIGNREYLDAVVGGTVAWNQAVRDSASENSTDFAPIVTVTDAVEDAAGVKVKIEPVQDLHGYDHPWPAGGGKNLLSIDHSIGDRQINGLTVKVNRNVSGDVTSVVVNGTATSRSYITLGVYYFKSGTILNGCPSGGAANSYSLAVDSTSIADRGNGYEITEDAPQGNLMIVIANGFVCNNLTFYPMVRLASETDGTFAPYSNICPITGWDGVQVWDDPVHGGNVEWNQISQKNKNPYTSAGVTYAITNGVCTATGTATASSYTTLTENTIPGHVYLVSIKDATNVRMWLFGYSSEATNTSAIYKKTASSNSIGLIVANGVTVNETVVPQIFDLTQMLGETKADEIYAMEQANAGSGVAYFKSLFPADYYPYNAGEITTVGAVNGEAYRHYTIQIPTEAGTVYGGTLTVNADGSGSLVVDRASVDLGTLTWNYTTSNRFFAVVPDAVNTNTDNTDLYCSAYAVRAVLSQGSAWMNQQRIFIVDSNYDNVSAFTSAMQGVQLVYPLDTPITYTLTATQVRTLLGTNNVWADTGDLALTYTGTDEHLTLASGKKYLSRISGTDSMLLGSGQEITAAKGTDNVFDLTQMFGTAVADYVYGQGAAFFRKWFPNAVYPYNAGELKHVEGLQSHDMVGFNAWDEEAESGYWDVNTGEKKAGSQWARCKNPVPVFQNTAYFFKATIPASGSFGSLIFLDSEGKVISHIENTTRAVNGVHTTPAGCAFIVFYANKAWFNYPICISLAHNGSRNGEYEPYEKHSYPLDSSVILRGIPKVGTNGVYWDGDRYLPDGTVERRYGMVGLSTIPAWNSDAISSSGYIRFITQNAYLTNKKEGYNLISDKLIVSYTVVPSSPNAEMISGFSGSKGVYVSILASKLSGDLSTANGRSTAFVNYLANNEITIVYELAEPTTETAQPYHSTQWVSDWGTEEFVSTSIVPVGTETRYPANLRDKLQHLPDAANGNGSYIITQTDGQMVLTPFPAPPSTAGNYVLKATVTGGVATYTWEVAT